MEYIEFRGKIEPLEVGREVLIAELSQIGFESFVETDNGVKGYVQKPSFEEGALKKIKLFSNPEFTLSYELETIADQNWNLEWEKNFDPINVDGRCIVRAQFHKVVDNVDFDIIIDPKMSFGTGHHETTYLMIKSLLNLDLNDKKVLDMGCGTAVLAILASKKKAKYVEAIDIDEWAYNNSIENIRNNNCNKIIVKRGGAELLGASTFDVVLANINRNILIKDMSKYAMSMSRNGILLLSGFFSLDQEMLLTEAEKFGMKKIASESKNDWTMLQLIKG